MIRVAAALEQVLSQAQPLAPLRVALDDALRKVLAEDIVCDRDSPPWDKALVDGYAVLASDVTQAGTRLRVIEEVTAGKVPVHEVQPGTCSRVMTGAPLPPNADAMVMIETTNSTADWVEFQQPAKRDFGILRRGTSMRQGEVVLQAGSLLRPVELGLLAEIGRTLVPIIRSPVVSILSTGDELVPPNEVPQGGQIRNSNGSLLSALVAAAGATPIPLGIARDNAADLRAKIEAGLEHDVLILSGGVSAGVLDLVPKTLHSLGVRQVFHKVDLKPGKPLWFGVRDNTLVFGLPGNPVSTLVCFALFVKPALRQLAGERRDFAPVVRLATLTVEHVQRDARETYLPAMLEGDTVTPLAWHGSADLRAITKANALLRIPGGVQSYAKGERLEVLDL